MKGKGGLITAGVILGVIRAWMQIRGTTKTPLTQWLVGYGTIMFFLAIVSEMSAEFAGGFALLIVVADLIENGESLFADVTSVVQGGVNQPSPTQTRAGTPVKPAAKVSG